VHKRIDIKIEVLLVLKTNVAHNSVSSEVSFFYGERYTTIVSYVIPEIITALLLVSLPALFDSYCVLKLQCTSAYAALGIANGLWHLLAKLSEAFSVAVVVIAGQCNGLRQFSSVGYIVKNTFWVAFVLGMLFSLALFFAAPSIYMWYGVTDAVLNYGVSYLRIRAISVFFMFVYCAFVGFLRGIKNTKVPMLITGVGALLFMVTDYIFVVGIPGLPSYGFLGSAVASAVQYGAMMLMAGLYVLWEPDHRKYAIKLFTFSGNHLFIKDVFSLSSWVAIDKVAFAAAYVWLCKMICYMGTNMSATYEMVKTLERIAFVPALACAQVMTTLVSNDYGIGHWNGIRANIERVMILAVSFVLPVLSIIVINRRYILGKLVTIPELQESCARVLPFLTILVLCDLIQVILSAALRGAANVKIVMLVRLSVLFLYFIPVSYFITQMPLQDNVVKFTLVYGSLYGGAAIMACIYLHRFYGHTWKNYGIKENNI